MRFPRLFSPLRIGPVDATNAIGHKSLFFLRFFSRTEADDAIIRVSPLGGTERIGIRRAHPAAVVRVVIKANRWPGLTRCGDAAQHRASAGQRPLALAGLVHDARPRLGRDLGRTLCEKVELGDGQGESLVITG